MLIGRLNQGVNMSIEENVFAFFKEEFPDQKILFSSKMFILERDSPLQEIEDEAYFFTLFFEKYMEKFNVEIDEINWDAYYPYEEIGFWDWILGRKHKSIRRKALTIEMFIQSAKAGKWLYD